jgi:hypothetical protein
MEAVMATKAKTKTARKAFNPANNLPPPKKKSPPGTTKSTRHHAEDWGATEVRDLKGLIKENTPTRVIGLKLGRTEAAIRDKVRELGLSLMPINRSPRTPANKK